MHPRATRVGSARDPDPGDAPREEKVEFSARRAVGGESRRGVEGSLSSSRLEGYHGASGVGGGNAAAQEHRSAAKRGVS